MVTEIVAVEPEELGESIEEQEPTDRSLRRFTISIVVGLTAVLIPYLFVLWDLWGGLIYPFRSVGPSNFYDLQAQAMAHGHLYIPVRSLGVEAFVHNNHAYTYFGVFPSLLRFPVLAIVPELDGHMTGPSMFLAWAVTALFTSLLLWRVRFLVRGDAIMEWSEAACCGVLTAVIMGGSVLVYLAANPWVYDEDFAWSVALTVAVLFALIGIVEKPTWKRVFTLGLLVLAADLNRLTTGWACVIGALMVGIWFAIGRGGTEKRRWAAPVIAAGFIPLAIGGAITWAKFGSPFSLPLADQVWTQINAHRRHFLAANNGKGFGVQFLPTTLWTYIKPNGLSVSPIFPFVTGPTTPPVIVGNAVFDQIYPSASITASMPMLFVLSVWGLVTAFRPRSIGLVRLTRIPLIAACVATGGVLLWGYIAERYVADFLPLLILAGIVGFIDVWRRAVRRSQRFRRGLVAGFVLLGLFGVIANFGIAAASMNSWTSVQATNYADAQDALSLKSLSSAVEHGAKLPYYAPAGQLFNVQNCSGFYLSNGIPFDYAPGQLLQHETWIPIEQGPGINHFVSFKLSKPAIQIQGVFPILKYGKTVVALQDYGFNAMRIIIENPSSAPPWPRSASPRFFVKVNHLYLLSIMTDPHLNSIQVRRVPVKDAAAVPNALKGGIEKGGLLVDHYLAGSGPAVVLPPPSQEVAQQAGLTINEVKHVMPDSRLCQKLG